MKVRNTTAPVTSDSLWSLGLNVFKEQAKHLEVNGNLQGTNRRLSGVTSLHSPCFWEDLLRERSCICLAWCATFSTWQHKVRNYSFWPIMFTTRERCADTDSQRIQLHMHHCVCVGDSILKVSKSFPNNLEYIFRNIRLWTYKWFVFPNTQTTPCEMNRKRDHESHHVISAMYVTDFLQWHSKYHSSSEYC